MTKRDITMDEIVEGMARAAWSLEAQLKSVLTTANITPEQLIALARGEACVVPVEPTDAMLEAGRKDWKKPRLHVSHAASDEFMTCGVIYRAMLAALKARP